MKRIFTILILLLVTLVSKAQTGAIGDPFISLTQAAAVTTAGTYYFNIGGNTFSTQVNASGYVQMAIDFGNGTGNLPQGTSLTSSSRGILSPAVLSTLSDIIEVRISTSTGVIDVSTTDPTIISRIQSNTTLHNGTPDNAINNNWAGTNAGRLTGDATCNTVSGGSLNQNIFHACGNTETFNWIQSGDYQRELWSAGESADATTFFLWVKGGGSTLPIELVNFNAELIENNYVQLKWETATEINNDFFSIERSNNGINWETLTKLNGAGNSTSLMSYSEIDKSPYTETSYYRLKQTDFNGEFEYFQVKSIYTDIQANIMIETYPNPVSNLLTIETNSSELKELSIFNAIGKNVTSLTSQTSKNDTKLVIDLSKLNTGIYYIKTKTFTKKITKL